MAEVALSSTALGAAQAVAVALHALAQAVLAQAVARALGALVPILLHELGPQRVIELHGVLRIQGHQACLLRVYDNLGYYIV